MLKRSFFSDIYKYSSLPTFKFTFFLILGVNIFFSIQNIQVINALAEGNGQAVNLDPSMLSSNPVYTAVSYTHLSFITFSTSPTISGSRAEVGSSKSMTSGFIAKPRAMATRCF